MNNSNHNTNEVQIVLNIVSMGHSNNAQIAVLEAIAYDEESGVVVSKFSEGVNRTTFSGEVSKDIEDKYNNYARYEREFIFDGYNDDYSLALYFVDWLNKMESTHGVACVWSRNAISHQYKQLITLLEENNMDIPECLDVSQSRCIDYIQNRYSFVNTLVNVPSTAAICNLSILKQFRRLTAPAK